MRGGMTGRAAIDKEKTMAEFTIPQRMTSFVEDTTHTVSTVPRKLIDASRGALCTTREEAEHLMERGEDLFEKLVERGQEINLAQTSRLTGWWKGWEKRSRDQIHVAEEQLEHQVQTVLRALHIPSSDDIKRLDAEIDRIGKKLDMQLTERALAALPIENYKGMNVKDVAAQLDTLDEAGLRAVQAFETDHHNRKTILREIEQRLEAMNA
jgi:polyhydroxyalkanoate synthesis regulator phasin